MNQVEISRGLSFDSSPAVIKNEFPEISIISKDNDHLTKPYKKTGTKVVLMV